MSNIREINANILQKSFISLIFFLFFNISLIKKCKTLRIKIEVLNFVNDINILEYNRFIEEICKTLSKAYNICAKWACTHDATFTSEKYEFTHFIRKSKRFDMMINIQIESSVFLSFFFFFIKCMQSMTMTLSRRCMYAKLHVLWPKSLLYIFSLINHIDSLRIQALFLNSHHCTFVFLCFFAFLTFYSFVSNSHFLVAIRVFFKYFSVAILSILMMNSVNIVSVFLSWAFSLSFICSAL